MTELLLHIGHNKTGSTHLQSLFAQNSDLLLEKGIFYPNRGRPIDLDVMTLTGNAMGLLRSPQKLKRTLEEVLADNPPKVLLSSETLFDRIHESDNVDFMREVARRTGVSDVRVLLFTRDPIGHAVSFWQQRVKGWQAETRTLDAYLSEDFDFPTRVRDVLEKLDRIGAEVTVRNYSRHAKVIMRCVQDWLGLDPATELETTATERINRSLCAGEVELQRALNRHLGASGKLFAFHMANSFPDAPKQLLTPSRDAQRRAAERLREDIEAVNARLLKAEGYRLEGTSIFDRPRSSVAVSAA